MSRALAVLTLAFLCPAEAAAADLPVTMSVQSALAVGADGIPAVAAVQGNRLDVLRRSAVGAWAGGQAARLPSATGTIAGFRVNAAGRTFVLVEDRSGSWLVLVDGNVRWRSRRIASAPRGDALGPAGLALDRRGRPVVAYALRHRTQKTSLRLVIPPGRPSAVTRNGFPESRVAPAVAPMLLPSRRIGVVEAYASPGSAAILWRRLSGAWWGRFLHSNRLGVPFGPVFATSDEQATFALLTVSYPAFGEQHVVLTRAQEGRRVTAAVLHRAAVASALVGLSGGPVIALNEPVDGTTAGLLARPGTESSEVDGAVVDAAAAADGTLHVLLSRPGGAYWYRSSRPFRARISLRAERTPEGSVGLSGRVEDVSSGTVELYREPAAGVRTRVGNASIAADGSFAFSDDAAGPVRYRAVYPDPDGGLPHAALLRRSV